MHKNPFLLHQHMKFCNFILISRYEVKNKQIEFSTQCGPALSQLRGIDLVVNKLLREDYSDNELVEVDIKAEKFIVSSLCA